MGAYRAQATGEERNPLARSIARAAIRVAELAPVVGRLDY